MRSVLKPKWIVRCGSRWRSEPYNINRESLVGKDVQKKLEIAYERVQREKQRVMAGVGSAKGSGVGAVGESYAKYSFKPVSEVFTAEMKEKARHPGVADIEQPADPRCVKAVLLGLSNTGKSSLINNILHEHISPVSPKAYCTRHWILGSCVTHKTQVILLDTPSLSVPLMPLNPQAKDPQLFHEAKRRLLTTEASWEALHHADVAIVVVDGDKGFLHKGHLEMLDALEKRLHALDHVVQVMVCVTKLDLFEYPEEALTRIKTSLKESGIRFSNVLPILRGRGDSYLRARTALVNMGRPGDWMFPQSQSTTQTLDELMQGAIQERVIRHIPRGRLSAKYCQVRIAGWTEKHKNVTIDCVITVASVDVKSIIIKNLTTITEETKKAWHRRVKDKSLGLNIHMAVTPVDQWSWENPYGYFKPSWHYSEVSYTMAEGPSGLTCGVWIPRGASQKMPEKYQPTAEEMSQARNKMAMLAAEENKDGDDEMEDSEEELENKEVELDEGEGEGEEEEEDSDYGPTLDVPVQGAEGIHEIESDDESEIEDLQIKSDDLVFMCTHQRQTGNSALEIYVYDDEQDNIYLHHDITLPAIPLSVACSSHGRGKDGAAMEDGSFAAVTTFLPFIEVWDLNILDAPDPTVTLGGCKRASDNYRAKTLTPSMLMKSSHKDAVLTAKWNTEVQKVLASGSADCTVKLWDLVTGDNLHTFKQHEAPVQCLHWFKQQPQSLLSGGFDQCAKVVDCRTQKTQCSISLGGAPEAIVVSPFEENRIWITLEDGSLQQYDLRSTGAPMWSIKAHESEATIAVNPGINGLVATAGADRHVKLWDVRGDAPANLASRDLGQGRVFSLQFSADKPTYLLGSGDEGKPLVYCVTDDVSSAFKA